MENETDYSTVINDLQFQIKKLEMIQSNVIDWQVSDIKAAVSESTERLNKVIELMDAMKARAMEGEVRLNDAYRGLDAQSHMVQSLEAAFNALSETYQKAQVDGVQMKSDIVRLSEKVDPMHSMYVRTLTISLCLALTGLLITNGEILANVAPKILEMVKKVLM